MYDKVKFVQQYVFIRVFVHPDEDMLVEIDSGIHVLCES